MAASPPAAQPRRRPGPAAGAPARHRREQRPLPQRPPGCGTPAPRLLASPFLPPGPAPPAAAAPPPARQKQSHFSSRPPAAGLRSNAAASLAASCEWTQCSGGTAASCQLLAAHKGHRRCPCCRGSRVLWWSVGAAASLCASPTNCYTLLPDHSEQAPAARPTSRPAARASA